MDPQQQPLSSVPVSPEEAGTPISPEMGGQEEMSQEEMRANLQELMAKIKSRYEVFSAQTNSSKESLKEQKDLALRDVFDLFKNMGIDPGNPDQVRVFLDGLKQTNPELSQQIEKALKTLIEDDEEIGILPEGEVPSEDMNINGNETIQQNL